MGLVVFDGHYLQAIIQAHELDELHCRSCELSACTCFCETESADVEIYIYIYVHTYITHTHIYIYIYIYIYTYTHIPLVAFERLETDRKLALVATTMTISDPDAEDRALHASRPTPKQEM